MKFTTLKLLLVFSSFTCLMAQAHDKPAPQNKLSINIVDDEIKRGPLADFYELVAQHPNERTSAKVPTNTMSEINSSSQPTLPCTTQTKLEPKLVKQD